MLSYLLLIALCQATQGHDTLSSSEPVHVKYVPTTHPVDKYVKKEVDTKPHPSTANTMEVVLQAEDHYNNELLEDIYDDFQNLFIDFARNHGIYFNKRNLHRKDVFTLQGYPMAKYDVVGVECRKFQDFLLNIRPQNYHIQFAHVSCGRMTFSVCTAFSCPKLEFHNYKKLRW